MSMFEVVSESQTINVLSNQQPLIVGPMVTQSIVVPGAQSIIVNPSTLQTIVTESLNPIIETGSANPPALVMTSVPNVSIVVESVPVLPDALHPAQEAFLKANALEERSIEYVDELPSTIRYYKENVLQYTSTITYINELPSFVTLVNQVTNAAFVKIILYENDLPIGVEWQTV